MNNGTVKTVQGGEGDIRTALDLYDFFTGAKVFPYAVIFILPGIVRVQGFAEDVHIIHDPPCAAPGDIFVIAKHGQGIAKGRIAHRVPVRCMEPDGICIGRGVPAKLRPIDQNGFGPFKPLRPQNKGVAEAMAPFRCAIASHIKGLALGRQGGAFGHFLPVAFRDGCRGMVIGQGNDSVKNSPRILFAVGLDQIRQKGLIFQLGVEIPKAQQHGADKHHHHIIIRPAFGLEAIGVELIGHQIFRIIQGGRNPGIYPGGKAFEYALHIIIKMSYLSMNIGGPEQAALFFIKCNEFTPQNFRHLALRRPFEHF